MRSKEVMFFATIEDIKDILQSLESEFPIQYFEMGLFDERQPTQYDSIFEIQDLGISQAGDWNLDRRLMILSKNDSLIIRDVPQRKGGIKYAIDPSANPDSIYLQLGGVYTRKVLLAGKCGFVGESEFSNKVYKYFSSKVKKAFKRIGAFYVGKQAQEKLTIGWRLVTNHKQAEGYDLAFE